MYNFGELKFKVGELAQRSDDSNYLAKIGIWLQLSHRFLSEIYDYWLDLQDVHNFSTVDGQEDYPLPGRFDKPLRIFDLTNKTKIKIQTEEEYFDENISAIADADEGTSDTARIYGSTGSLIPLASTGSIVKVKSSSSSDTGSIKVMIEGYIDSARLILDEEEIIISTGTPTTYVSGTKTFYGKLTQISKSANTVGYISVANSADVVIETIAPEERVVRHKVLKLGKIPSGVNSMRLLFKRTVKEMVGEYSYPFTECDRYLIFDSFGFALKQDKEDSRAEFAWGKAAEALKVILANQNSKLGPEFQHKMVSKFLKMHKL
jgi:hypothetical protein